MAEAVHIVARHRHLPEFFQEIALAVQPLAHERFSGGDVAVRLYPPAAYQFPSAFFYPLSDLLEHGRIVLLNPLVKSGAAAGENEFIVLLHPVQGGAEGCLGFLEALLPVPQPDRIQMRISDHVEFFVLHFSVDAPLCSRFRAITVLCLRFPDNFQSCLPPEALPLPGTFRSFHRNRNSVLPRSDVPLCLLRPASPAPDP